MSRVLPRKPGCPARSASVRSSSWSSRPPRPIIVIGGSAPLGFLLGNGVGFPALFAVCAVILVLFAVGLVAVAKRIPKPGGFFTFVGYGLGKPPGLSAAYLALLTYTTILIVGALGYRRIDLSFKVLGVLQVCEVGIVLALVLAVVATSGHEGLSATPFLPSAVFSGSPGIGLMFAFAAFLGFESTVIFRDEGKTPDRTIPKATYTAVIGVGVSYTITAFVLIAIFAALTSIAVIVYFRTADTDRQLWNTLIAPGIRRLGVLRTALRGLLRLPGGGGPPHPARARLPPGLFG